MAVNGAHVVRATLDSRWVENPMMGWGRGGVIELSKRRDDGEVRMQLVSASRQFKASARTQPSKSRNIVTLYVHTTRRVLAPG